MSAPVTTEAHMSNETTTIVAGNLTADPELRSTASRVPVAHFTVASTSGVQHSTSGERRDGDTLFLRCTVCRRMAEHVAESPRQGNRVVVIGLQQRMYETADGEKRSTIELVADEVSVSLRHAVARLLPSRSSIESVPPATAPPQPAEGALP
jgi:single-strand DNA-binding protein